MTDGWKTMLMCSVALGKVSNSLCMQHCMAHSTCTLQQLSCTSAACADTIMTWL
jgi:hypothetical protein